MARKRKKDIDVVLGAAWYSEQDWTRMRLICSDPEEMDESYAVWRAAAEKAMEDLRRLGQVVEKVEIDVDEFVRWCRLHGRNTDRASRAEFAVASLRAKKGRS
jgi:hypothetical protein